MIRVNLAGTGVDNERDICIAEYPKTDSARKYAAGALVRRFQQFYVENEEVVAQVAKAFDQADFKALGKLVDLSQVRDGLCS